MSYLIDPNVKSEVGKGARCDPAVGAWYASVADDELFLSVLVTGELRKGIEPARRRNADKAEALEAWLRQVEAGFGPRILPVDTQVANAWGLMNAVRPTPVVDGLLAATARIHDLTLVTRNDADVAGLGARVLNPFAASR